MNERTYQSVIGVLVIIIVFLAWWIFAHPGSGTPGSMSTTTDMTTTDTSVTSDQSSDTNSTSGTITPTNEAGGSESVAVSDQPAGMAVAVSSVTLSEPGWIAVRDTTGRTLGAAWFDTGTHTDVSVPLLRATTSGDKYQVLLYADNGDHVFDLHSDSLMTNSDGSVPGTTFSAQ